MAAAVAAVTQAIEAKSDPAEILNQGMIAAMEEVGLLFEEGQCFVPEMLMAARAMQAGLALLKPLLVDSGVEPSGKVAVGTVKGDLHDIGKNLVAMMLEGAGFAIIDLGTDVPPEVFVKAVQEHEPDLVGMSALLTTTIVSMAQTIEVLTEAGVREKIKIIVGGAPVTQEYADEIGADGFAADAGSAARLAKALLGLE
jgi:5-methyltetrahydrofolate--homocysteine methyltransferase